MIGQYALLAVIGLLFAVPFCVWVVADAKARHDAKEAYAVGYRDGQRAEFEAQARAYVARQSRELQYAQPAVIVVNPPAPQYTMARPFAALTAALDALPARPTVTNRCANWELCPDCHLPLTPDEHCPDWCGVPDGVGARKFREVGEVVDDDDDIEPYDNPGDLDAWRQQAINAHKWRTEGRQFREVAMYEGEALG